MVYFYGSIEKLNGDEAYNRGSYLTALKWYEQAVAKINQVIVAARHVNYSVYHELAYALLEVAQTRATYIGTLGTTSRDVQIGIRIYRELNANLNEAAAIIGTFLNDGENVKLHKKTKLANQVAFKNLYRLHRNRALDLLNNEPEADIKIEYKQEILSNLAEAFRFAQSLNALDDHSLDGAFNEINRLRLQINDSISDEFAELSEIPDTRNVPVPHHARVFSLNQAVEYNRQALDFAQQLNLHDSIVMLHLGYLNLQESLYKRTKNLQHRQELLNYIMQHGLTNANHSKELRIEVLSYQWNIAKDDLSMNLNAAILIAQTIYSLGSVNDNEELQQVYLSAKEFLIQQNVNQGQNNQRIFSGRNALDNLLAVAEEEYSETSAKDSDDAMELI